MDQIFIFIVFSLLFISTLQQATTFSGMLCKLNNCPINSDDWDSSSQLQALDFDNCLKSNDTVYEQLIQQGWNDTFASQYIDHVTVKCKPTNTDTFYFSEVYSCERTCESSGKPNYNYVLVSKSTVQNCIAGCPTCDLEDQCLIQQENFAQCVKDSLQCQQTVKKLDSIQSSDAYPSEMKPCFESCNPKNQPEFHLKTKNLNNFIQTTATDFTTIYNCQLSCMKTSSDNIAPNLSIQAFLITIILLTVFLIF